MSIHAVDRSRLCIESVKPAAEKSRLSYASLLAKKNRTAIEKLLKSVDECEAGDAQKSSMALIDTISEFKSTHGLDPTPSPLSLFIYVVDQRYPPSCAPVNDKRYLMWAITQSKITKSRHRHGKPMPSSLKTEIRDFLRGCG